MTKTMLIEFSPNHPPKEFNVGEFVSIGYPHGTLKGVVPQKPTFFKFLDWINDLAPKGLVYHSQYDGEFIFRVDGDVIEKLKNELKLDQNSQSEYVGENNNGSSMYKTSTTLLLYLDGDLISEVSLP